jgi:hypothetical protein
VALSGVEFCKTNIWSFVHNFVCSIKVCSFFGFFCWERIERWLAQ